MKERLETLGKLLIALAGSLYVIGLLVVNIHLSQFSYYSLNLLQLNYIAAGAWILLPIILAVVALTFLTGEIIDTAEGSKGKIRKKKILMIGFGVVMGIIISTGFLSAIIHGIGLPFGWKWFGIIVLGAVTALFVGSSLMLVRLPKEPKFSKQSIETLRFAMFDFLLCVTYLVLFAAYGYKDIPAAFGGGQPIKVKLVVKSDDKTYLEAVGVKFHESTNTTEIVNLILSTDSDYVILSEQGAQAVSIKRDIVNAVMYGVK